MIINVTMITTTTTGGTIKLTIGCGIDDGSIVVDTVGVRFVDTVGGRVVVAIDIVVAKKY